VALVELDSAKRRLTAGDRPVPGQINPRTTEQVCARFSPHYLLEALSVLEDTL